jgi:hypothetical protein
VNKQRAAERAKEDAIAVSVRALNSGMVVAGRRTPRVVAATDRLAAALNDAAIAIGRAMNDKDLDVEFMRAQKELHKDAQIENIRLDLRRRIDALGNKLKELQAEAAKTSPTLEESADRQ